MKFGYVMSAVDVNEARLRSEGCLKLSTRRDIITDDMLNRALADHCGR